MYSMTSMYSMGLMSEASEEHEEEEAWSTFVQVNEPTHTLIQLMSKRIDHLSNT